ncbi:uncharacterized protein [Macrobrachium rosenbergii]|uniref:uncharacterized protein n=1 Tax=Macrobrachium rosenbergii TaxID=79674 RepID=UPI0034D6DB6A
MKSFYVDNFLKTYDSVPEMKAECKQVKVLLADTGMPLTGWASNVVEFDEEVEADEPKVVTVLGMKWDRSKDALSLKGGKKMNESVRDGKLTKLKLFSLLVSNFDPLGLVSPVFMKGKLLLQDLWGEGVEWGEVLSLERQHQAQEILEQLESVEVFGV